MRIRSTLAAVTALAVIAGCGNADDSDPSRSMKTSALQEQVATEATSTGLKVNDVQCEKPLALKVGATATCSVFANDLKYTASIRATAVDGSDVTMDLRIPPPALVPVATLERQARALLADRIEGEVTGFDCSGELVGEVDQSTRCVLRLAEDKAVRLIVTVTEADFLNVKFAFSIVK